MHNDDDNGKQKSQPRGCCGHCGENEKSCSTFSFDLFLHGGAFVIFSALVYVAVLSFGDGAERLGPSPLLSSFAYAVAELAGKMWWGVALGLIAVGTLGFVPRTWFTAILGRSGRFQGLVRATVAGLFLDLCSHGILMVGVRLYERGVSFAQVMTFLIASPWNSLTLTFILIALVGIKLTLIYILFSAGIALVSGLIFQIFEKRGTIPANPNTPDLPDGFNLREDVRTALRKIEWNAALVPVILRRGWKDGKMVVRWLFFGLIVAALIRAYVPAEMMQTLFGPTLAGLSLTLAATTLIEVCSEGSTPIAADLVQRGQAPGNGFVFLMAGVSTDYTEILVLKDLMKSWRIASLLPLVTVPQILFLGWLLNAGV